MNSIPILIFGFLLAVLSSELVLKGTKLQTTLLKVLGIHLFWLITISICLNRFLQFSFVVVFLFWAGAFLSWFGVRSHLESSILLRMLFFIRKEPMTEKDLLLKYENHHSEASRLEELFRANLLERSPDGIQVTPKGRRILAAASFLHQQIR